MKRNTENNSRLIRRELAENSAYHAEIEEMEERCAYEARIELSDCGDFARIVAGASTSVYVPTVCWLALDRALEDWDREDWSAVNAALIGDAEKELYELSNKTGFFQKARKKTVGRLKALYVASKASSSSSYDEHARTVRAIQCHFKIRLSRINH